MESYPVKKLKHFLVEFDKKPAVEKCLIVVGQNPCLGSNLKSVINCRVGNHRAIEASNEGNGNGREVIWESNLE